ncbi:MAG: enoyl-CoA hydratase-related protein [Polyangiaceae bacterium]|jgi:enoyl-CoA hydratase
MPVLHVDRQDPIAVFTLNRPDKLNALNEEVFREMLEAIDAIDRTAGVRAVIVTGAGDKAFAAGADIAAMTEMSSAEAKRFADLGHRVGTALESARIPFIAAVNGFALGGGCELAMACDFIYASDKAKIGQPEVNLGVVPGFGGTQRLSRRVGAGRARELCMTGEILGAEAALRIGWVDAVVPHDQLRAHAERVAHTIASKAPLAIAAIKRTIVRGQDVALSTANELEAATFASLFGTHDQREGMRAFIEKRPPQFTGS